MKQILIATDGSAAANEAVKIGSSLLAMRARRRSSSTSRRRLTLSR